MSACTAVMLFPQLTCILETFYITKYNGNYIKYMHNKYKKAKNDDSLFSATRHDYGLNWDRHKRVNIQYYKSTSNCTSTMQFSIILKCH